MEIKEAPVLISLSVKPAIMGAAQPDNAAANSAAALVLKKRCKGDPWSWRHNRRLRLHGPAPSAFKGAGLRFFDCEGEPPQSG